MKAVRFFNAGPCYGNDDPEIRAAALAQAAVAFPGSALEICGPYNVTRAVERYERANNPDYAGQKFVASSVKVRATG